MKTFVFVIIPFLISSIALCEEMDVNLWANGYDWCKYLYQQKKLLVSFIYGYLNVDRKEFTIEDGVSALDNFYYTAILMTVNDDKLDRDTFLSETCMETLRDAINYKKEPQK